MFLLFYVGFYVACSHLVSVVLSLSAPKDDDSPFAYPSHLTLFKGVKMEDVDPKAPSYSSFTVTPALPTGIVIDVKTGVLSGTPMESMESTEFTITGLKSSGEVGQAVITIVIKVFAYPSHLTLFKGVKMEDVDPKAPS